jgi:hypothetical protein
MATTKKKARPTTAGERCAELVEELRSLGANPENFLYLAVEAERKARAIPVPRSLVATIEEHRGLVLFSPSVLHELCRASAIAGGAEPGQEAGAGKRARTLLARVFKALASAGETSRLLDERRKGREVLVLAKAVQTEAERLAKSKPAHFARSDGRPSVSAVATARASVAKKAGLTVSAMQLRIRRAADAFPDASWPALMPRPPKKPRA